MEDSLGSLSSFMVKSRTPDIKFQKRTSTKTPRKTPATNPRKKKSAKHLVNLEGRDYCKVYLGKSTEGYCYGNKFRLTQEKVFQQTRPQSVWYNRSRSNKSQRPSTTVKNSKRIRRKPQDEQLSTFESNNIEQKLKTELQMKGKHHLLRTMKKTREYVSQTPTINPQTKSDQKIQPLKRDPRESLQKTQIQTKNKHLFTTSKEAKRKLRQTEVGKWLKARGIEQSNENNLNQFAIEFFAELDKDQQKYLTGEDLLDSLLRLGIATDCILLKQTLCNIFKKKSIEELKIDLKEFKTLFKGDSKTDSILNKLNQECIKIQNELKAKLNEKNQKFVKNPLMYKKLMNETASTNFFKLGLGAKLTGKKGLKLRKNAEKMITINEHEELIKKWWHQLNPKLLSSVPTSEVIEKLVELDIFIDKNEGRRIIYSNIGIEKFLSYENYQKIFARSMLKGALLNLSKRLFEGKYALKEMSHAFKITAYQRALIFSGIKCPNSDISIEEGVNTLGAIEEYLKKPQTEHFSLQEIKTRLIKKLGITSKYLETLEKQIKSEKNISGKITNLLGLFGSKKPQTQEASKPPQSKPEPDVELFLTKRNTNPPEIVESPEPVIQPEERIEMQSSSPNCKFYMSVIRPQSTSPPKSLPEKPLNSVRFISLLKAKSSRNSLSNLKLPQETTQTVPQDFASKTTLKPKSPDLFYKTVNDALFLKESNSKESKLDKARRRSQVEEELLSKFQALVSHIPSI